MKCGVFVIDFVLLGGANATHHTHTIYAPYTHHIHTIYTPYTHHIHTIHTTYTQHTQQTLRLTSQAGLARNRLTSLLRGQGKPEKVARRSFLRGTFARAMTTIMMFQTIQPVQASQPSSRGNQSRFTPRSLGRV